MFVRCCTFVLLICITSAATAAADTWCAGAAKINITPPQPMWMAGYASRSRPAAGKVTDLWAKALVLEDAEGSRGVLVTLDLIGIDRQLAQSICDKLKEEYQLDRSQIVLSTSHTHTGPVVARNLRPMHYELLDAPQRKLVDDYSRRLERQIVEVVGQAIERLADCRISWGSGLATFAVNRRTNSEAKVPELRAAGKLAGPHDHDVPVLAVSNKEGKLVAVVFGYACHATVLSFYQWSGDYPGFAQMELERRHPDCIALFWAGCGGDQNPLPRRKLELAKDYGRQLADSVDAVLAKKMMPIDGQLSISYREIVLPLGELPTAEDLARDAKSNNRYVAARARFLLSMLEKGAKLAPAYPYPISVWRIGSDVQFVSLGGEVVVDYALRLKSELSGKRTWVAGYAHDVMAYIPSRRVLREGGYEGGGAMVYYGLPTVWSPEVENLIVKEVHRQIKDEPVR